MTNKAVISYLNVEGIGKKRKRMYLGVNYER
jgi:hypothetical protein